ncbi:unnamed protein product [Clavelina lepadiformis]|uniref:Uncharacterized protein n=1 Tax=Clavelina lepadiformis TaxID=159417 RepID=A0ABP0GL36_CLALP
MDNSIPTPNFPHNVEGACTNTEEEVVVQRKYVINRLLKQMNELSTEVKEEYLKQKWTKNPDGSVRQSVKQQARLTCTKLEENGDLFDDAISSLKQKQSELFAKIAKKQLLYDQMNKQNL